MRRERDPVIEELLVAAELGNTDRVFALLDSGLDVNGGCPFTNETVLMRATIHGHVALMQQLLDRGANLEVENSKGYTALTYALVLSGDWPGWQISDHDHRPLDLLRASGSRFRLMEAVLLNDLALVRTRLAEGADPNTGEWRYDGPVLMITARLGHLAIVDLLLDHGAIIEALDDLNQTALTVAVAGGHIAVARRLLDRGANVHAGNSYGESVLSIALKAGDQDSIELLRSRGARWSAGDALALNDIPLLIDLLDEAIRAHAAALLAEPIEDNLDEDDPATQWICRSAVDQISDWSVRLAVVAADRGNVAAVNLLLDRGAAHLLDRHEDHSMLAAAARSGHLEVIRLLLDRSADFRAVGLDQRTPLAWAIQHNQKEAAALLRQAGATH